MFQKTFKALADPTRREILNDERAGCAHESALADPTRREILNLLKDGKRNAGEIASRFEMSAATISHHLSVLKDAGLVLDEKEGKYIYYELNTSVMDEIIGWISSLTSGGH